MNSTTDITFEEAGNILLNVSKWKNADMHTVKVSYVGIPLVVRWRAKRTI